MEMTEEDYLESVDAMEGFCTTCNDVSGLGVEGDAEGYHCDTCDTASVMGMENALMKGLLGIVAD